MEGPSLQFLVKLIALIVVVPVACWGLTYLAAPARRRKLRALLLLAGASTALSLLAAEGLVRLAFREITTTAQPSPFTRRWRAEHPPIANRLGFREREFADRPEAGTYRIAVVGDSLTWGLGIETRDRLTESLESRLDALPGAYEVLNFGKVGAATVDHVQVLREAVLPISPDFVLLQWYVNDGEDDKSPRPKPWPIFPSTLLDRHSVLYYLANQQWGSLQVRLGLVESYEEYLVRRFSDPASADSAAARLALVDFIRRARDAGVTVGIILFPQLSAEYAGGLVSSYSLAFLMDRVLETCAEQGVICLDLRATFAPVVPAHRLWVNRLDSHPNRLANELAADAALERFGPIWREQAR